MSLEKILSDWKKNLFKPLYWLEGEEEFYINVLMQYAEHQIISDAESSFNLTVFYGKDANWTEVINACRRYPMFAERQVVLLKEAQQMKDIDKLESYISNPLSSTVLVVSYKGKTIDGRSRLAKILKLHGEVLTTKKLYDSQLSGWTTDFINTKGLEIGQRALMLLVNHIGNDLNRIASEVEKLSMNMGSRKNITEDDIENYVGVSKEYNVFELQEAFSKKDLVKAFMIIKYFEANPKAAPIQMLLPALYNHFSKVATIFQLNDKSEKALKLLFYNNSFAVKQALETVINYSYSGVEQAIMLLHEYNLKSLGINNAVSSDASLLKEMAVKIIHPYEN
jgi:DNA polymerase III subunit delta